MSVSTSRSMSLAKTTSSAISAPGASPSLSMAGLSRLKVKLGDRWLIPGMTESGKTTFSKLLSTQLSRLYPQARFYILDSKFAGDFDQYPGRVMSDVAPPRPSSNERVQVWQPILINPDEVEKWLWQVLHDPPAILFVDELVHLCYGRKSFSENYSRIQKLGRMLPVGCITCTQELVDIPRNALGQATHIARFRLNLPYEQRLMKSIMHSKADMPEPMDQHGFYFGSTASGAEPLYFRDAQSFLKIDFVSSKRGRNA